MREGFISFGHAMSVFTFLDGVTTVIRCIKELCSKALFHGFFATAAGKAHNPADCQSIAALGTNLDGNLVGRTANSTRFDFDSRANIFNSLLENLDRLIPGTLLDNIKSAVNNMFSSALLTVES
jgi:hypothetical protein